MTILHLYREDTLCPEVTEVFITKDPGPNGNRARLPQHVLAEHLRVTRFDYMSPDKTLFKS